MHTGGYENVILKYNETCAKFNLLYKHYVSFAFYYNSIMSHLHFVVFVFCLIYILLHLYFVTFAFCYGFAGLLPFHGLSINCFFFLIFKN